MPTRLISKIKDKWNEYWAKKNVEFGGSTYPDGMFGIPTGKHHYAKQFISLILSPHIKKIEVAVNLQYNEKTLSTNAKIFKQILSEFETIDKDPGDGTLKLGYKRKDFLILLMKYAIVQYDIDSHYMERADWLIKRLLEEQNKLYIDEQSNPKNWWPTRNNYIFGKYLLLRNREVKQP